MGVKIKHTKKWSELISNPVALLEFLPCPANGCTGRATSNDKGKTFVCPECNLVQTTEVKK